MKFSLPFLLCFSFNLWSASDFSVETEGKKLFLYGNNCESIKAQYLALKKWTQKIEEPAEDGADCQKSNSDRGAFQIEITGVVPTFVKKNHKIKIKCDSPNCFNAALNANSLLHSVRFSYSNELTFYLENEKLCKKIAPNGILEPGDIVRVQQCGGRDSVYWSDVHAFTYITNELSFHKKGLANIFTYEFISTEKNFTDWGGQKECFNTAEKDKCCVKEGDQFKRTFAEIYRCQSIEVFQKNHAADWAPYKELNSSLEEIECGVGQAFLDNGFDIKAFVKIDRLSRKLFPALRKLPLPEKFLGKDSRALIEQGLLFNSKNLSPDEFFRQALFSRMTVIEEGLSYPRGLAYNKFVYSDEGLTKLTEEELEWVIETAVSYLQDSLEMIKIFHRPGENSHFYRKFLSDKLKVFDQSVIAQSTYLKKFKSVLESARAQLQEFTKIEQDE